MAQLKRIKEIAQARKITIEELADKIGVKAQAIHLMVRTGSTRIETLERIAEVLEVPTKIFFDEKFDITEFQRLVIQGHHNPFSIYGSAVVYEGKKPESGSMTDADAVVQAKDETIAALKQQVSDLRRDKDDLRATNETLRQKIAELEKVRN